MFFVDVNDVIFFYRLFGNTTSVNYFLYFFYCNYNELYIPLSGLERVKDEGD